MGAQQSIPAGTSSARELHEKLGELALARVQPLDELEGADSLDEKTLEAKMTRQAEGLPVRLTKAWQTDILKDPKNQLAIAALSSNNPKTVLTSLPTKLADPHIYNVKIPFEGAPITNQNSSGRCWLFASTNIFRIAIMQRYGLDSFQLSQQYLFFWDKLEKSNWFLEQMIQTSRKDVDGRTVQALFGDIASDGGQWDMVYNLVAKYGIVPQAFYPDTYNSKNSRVINSVVKTKLREYGMKLRAMSADDTVSAAQLSDAKKNMMADIHLIMTVMLGPPPNPESKFTWEFVDKSGAAHEVTMTPKELAAEIYGTKSRLSATSVPIPKISDMISLVNDPRHKPLTHLTVNRLGNIVGGRDVTYINVDMPTLKAACVGMLRAGLPVFFGSDVGQFSETSSGVMDLDLYDYSLGFNVGLLNMTKAERLHAKESQMTHAMVLTGVHVNEDGKTVRWRVMNSWGGDVGDKGYFVMTDAWMDQFVYQAVVDPQFVSKEVRDVKKQQPTVLPLWDPMGALA